MRPAVQGNPAEYDAGHLPGNGILLCYGVCRSLHYIPVDFPARELAGKDTRPVQHKSRNLYGPGSQGGNVDRCIKTPERGKRIGCLAASLP